VLNESIQDEVKIFKDESESESEREGEGDTGFHELGKERIGEAKGEIIGSKNHLGGDSTLAMIIDKVVGNNELFESERSDD
jgi:hypothetical protein